MWLLVLVFLMGPLEGRLFPYAEPGDVVYKRFGTMEECAAKGREVGPMVEAEFQASDEPALKLPFKLGCIQDKASPKT